MMIRRVNACTAGDFDLAIVGAGIHGAVLALAASRAGYRTVLLERGDFAQATSANSLKIIHGGIRYLQHGDLRRMRQSIAARRSMMAFAPHLVKPLPCLMPTYGHGLKGREMMRIAFALYDAVAWDRNQGLGPAGYLPGCAQLSAARVRELVPGLERADLSGGAVWHDAIALDSERLVLEYLLEAARYGTIVANYTEAGEVDAAAGRVSGLFFRDRIDGGQGRLSCRAVVHATGPWLDGLDRHPAQGWASAVNIVVRKRVVENYAVGLEGYTDYVDKDALLKRGKRLFFFVPWLDRYTMIGTSYAPHPGPAESFVPDRTMYLQLLEDVNRIYPAADLKGSDLTFGHAGLLPMQSGGDGGADSVQLEKSSQVIDHGQRGGPFGLFSIKGVKYTTAPVVAEQAVALLRRRLGRRRPGCYQNFRRRHLDLGGLCRRLGEMEPMVRAHLQQRYGSAWRVVYGYLDDPRAMAGGTPRRLAEQPLLLAAELLYFLREEMALSLADVLFRRSNLGCAESPAESVLQEIAQLMGEELAWGAEEERRQLAAVRCLYQPFREDTAVQTAGKC